MTNQEQQTPSKTQICVLCQREVTGEHPVCPYDGGPLIVRRPDRMLGTRISDKYEIQELLTRGGMGVIYRGKHLALDRPVAIKCIAEVLTFDPSSWKRFETEAKSASLLNHPNIITIHDFGVTEHGDLYLVMEYLEGASLQDFLELNGQLNERTCAKIFSQVCDALAHAHGMNILHRDLKPTNIFISSTSRGPHVKVLDFGLAKAMVPKGNNKEKITRTGECLGTPDYMSPEQSRGMKIDQRSDIYATGVCMYEALAGKLPFEAEDMMQVLSMQISEKPPSFKEISPNKPVKKEMEALVMKCLEKDPQKRFQSMSELLAALNHFLQSEETKAAAQGQSKNHSAGQAQQGKAAQGMKQAAHGKEQNLVQSKNPQGKEQNLVQSKNQQGKEQNLVQSKNQQGKEQNLVQSKNQAQAKDQNLFQSKNQAGKDPNLVQSKNQAQGRDVPLPQAQDYPITDPPPKYVKAADDEAKKAPPTKTVRINYTSETDGRNEDSGENTSTASGDSTSDLADPADAAQKPANTAQRAASEKRHIDLDTPRNPASREQISKISRITGRSAKMALWGFAAAAILLICTATAVLMPSKKEAPPQHTVNGILYYYDKSGDNGRCELNVEGRTLHLSIYNNEAVKISNPEGLLNGAIWKFTYHQGINGLELDSAEFSGTVDPVVKDADSLVRHHYGQLGRKEWRAAYDNIDPKSTLRKSNFDEFQRGFKMAHHNPDSEVAPGAATKIVAVTPDSARTLVDMSFFSKGGSGHFAFQLVRKKGRWLISAVKGITQAEWDHS